MANPGTDPDVAIGSLLVAGGGTIGGASITKGTNLFEGPPRPGTGGSSPLVPHAAIFVVATGGTMEALLGDSADHRRIRVQITVRSKPGQYEAGYDDAKSALAVLQRNEPSGYYSLTTNQAWPQYIGQDDTECHRWTINCQLGYVG